MSNQGPILSASSLRDAMAAVVTFHQCAGFDLASSPAMPPSGPLALQLIREEAEEVASAFAAAMDSRCRVNGVSMTHVAQELADLVYVTLGAAARLGIDLGPVFDEVHRANLAKAGGPRRADGKLLKPPGWTPPDIQAVLQKQPAGTPP